MKQKREKLYYIAAAFFVLVAVGIDIYLINNGGAFIERHLRENMAHEFNGGFFDWAGIILFNAGLLYSAAGMVGLWETSEAANSTGKTILFAVGAAATLFMIYI